MDSTKANEIADSTIGKGKLPVKMVKKEKETLDLKRVITGMLDLPRELTMNLPIISMVGSEELFIENYKGVIEYTEEKVRINTSCGILKIEGKKIFLKQITAENISLTGKITALEYLY